MTPMSLYLNLAPSGTLTATCFLFFSPTSWAKDQEFVPTFITCYSPFPVHCKPVKVHLIHGSSFLYMNWLEMPCALQI
jgi:hypothetical protein